MNIDQNTYKKAFQSYLRSGTPIERSLKQQRPTTYYIWRTRGDRKVRSSHAALDGHVFAWDNPPATGHPGEDYGCRCIAEPYFAANGSHIAHELSSLPASQDRWHNLDFLIHFYTGQGKGVTLSEIGHLQEISRLWAYQIGALGRWTQQIIDTGRHRGIGEFSELFVRSYSFKDAQFSHGSSTVEGVFTGTVQNKGNFLEISGTTHYLFTDVFTDPLDLREISAWIRERPDRVWRALQSAGVRLGLTEPADGRAIEIDENDLSKLFWLLSEAGGTLFNIRGEWTSTLNAIVPSESTQGAASK